MTSAFWYSRGTKMVHAIGKRWVKTGKKRNLADRLYQKENPRNPCGAGVSEDFPRA